MAEQTKNDPAIYKGEGKVSIPNDTCISRISPKEKTENRYVDITAMIRSLQRTEGQSDCFRRGIMDCDELKCTWRQYCLGKKSGDL